jgi:hypothetical protein
MGIIPVSSQQHNLPFLSLAFCFTLIPATLAYLVLDAIGMSFKQTHTSFSENVKVITIPSRQELKAEKLIRELWYTKGDYKRFKANALRKIKNSNPTLVK